MESLTLSPKEADYLSDLMTYESILCKKCEFYGKTMFDENVSSVFNELAEESKRRFTDLYNTL